MNRLNAVVLGLTLGCIAPVALPVAAMAEPPIITTRWEKTDLEFEACRDKTAQLLRDAGFLNAQKMPSSVYGTQGNYAATIRCLGEEHVIYFSVAGPDGKFTERYANQMADKL